MKKSTLLLMAATVFAAGSLLAQGPDLRRDRRPGRPDRPDRPERVEKAPRTEMTKEWERVQAELKKKAPEKYAEIEKLQATRKKNGTGKRNGRPAYARIRGRRADASRTA